MPGLLEGSRNARIQPGQPGFVNVSEGWNPIDVPADLSRKGGDVHPQGNPHLNLDPRAGAHIAGRVLAALAEVDPRRRRSTFPGTPTYAKRLAAAGERWAAMAKPWKGKKVVVYHKEYDYIADALRPRDPGAIEAKPGIPPTPNHIASSGRQDEARARRDAILTATWSNNDAVRADRRADRARRWSSCRTSAAACPAPNMDRDDGRDPQRLARALRRRRRRR